MSRKGTGRYDFHPMRCCFRPKQYIENWLNIFPIFGPKKIIFKNLHPNLKLLVGSP